jgi:hypothetical protein
MVGYGGFSTSKRLQEGIYQYLAISRVEYVYEFLSTPISIVSCHILPPFSWTDFYFLRSDPCIYPFPA